MTEKNGKAPTPEEFHNAAIEAGFKIIPEQSVKYLKMYLKTQKEGGAQKNKPAVEGKVAVEVKQVAPATSKEKAEKAGHSSVSAFAESTANSNGYKTEGKYNGIDYFKDASGSKVSYKEDTDSWAAISGGKMIAQGTGIDSFNSYVEQNKGQAPKPGTMAASPVSVSHKTDTAKKYGDVIPESNFGFSSKGIANEKALPVAVQKSILAYKGSAYHEINDAMRYSESFDPSKVSTETMVNILNLQRAFAAVAPSKQDVTVGRKIKLDGLKSMVKDAGLSDLNDLKEGMVLRDPGIVSTSHSATVWSGDVRFEIKLPKGSKVIDISETITKNQGEQEVILGPDSKLKISSVKSGEAAGVYKYHITCELVQ